MDAWSSSASLFNSRASPFCAVRSLVPPPWVLAPFLPRECPRCALSSAFSVASRRFSDRNRASLRWGAPRSCPLLGERGDGFVPLRDQPLELAPREHLGGLRHGRVRSQGVRRRRRRGGVRSDSDDAPMPPSDGPLTLLFHPVLQHPRQPPLHLLHPLHPGVGRRRRRGRLPRALPLGAPKRLRRVRLQVADLVEDGVERGCDL